MHAARLPGYGSTSAQPHFPAIKQPALHRPGGARRCSVAAGTSPANTALPHRLDRAAARRWCSLPAGRPQADPALAALPAALRPSSSSHGASMRAALLVAAARKGGRSRAEEFYADEDAEPGGYSGRSSGSSAGSSRGSSNPIDAIQQELRLQSNKLQPDLRQQVERAIEDLGCRATAGEVAAKAGVKLSEAEEALQALAYDCLAALEVSQQGDLAYVFPPDFKSRLARKSLRVRLQPLLAKLQGLGSYLLRVSFGSALVASVVVVWTALAALLSGNRDDNRRRGGGGGGMMPFRVFVNLSDLLWYWDPYYYRATRAKIDSGEELSFVEAIFSFVFGDGDPNSDFEERRWAALGRRIQQLGGVVTAEEMAPFLDPPPLRNQDSTSSGSAEGADGGWGAGSGRSSSSRTGPGRDAASAPAAADGYADESFVLPALLRFGGEPVVDPAGRLLYCFPQLQATAAAGSKGRRGSSAPKPGAAALERPWGFTAASDGQKLGVVLLGAVNCVGVLALSASLATPANQYLLVRGGYGFVLGLMPALQAYAAAFATIPLVRRLMLSRRNAAIEGRNAARRQAAALLERVADLGGGLQDKALAARALGQRRVVGQRDVVFDSSKPAGPQLEQIEMEEFDRRLGS